MTVSETTTNKESDSNARTEAPPVENNTDEKLMPVFSEWTQQIQEAEKKLVELNSNSSDVSRDNRNETSSPKQPIVKIRQKNYASPDCGAKILSSSPESQSTSSVLSDKDEYMLSPCTEKIWFVVELCEAIQASKVELANTELFSSPLKEVSISVSNRYPTRDWTLIGKLQAKLERNLQVFELNSSIFGKFIRVDLTYTNTEHYCPLSFFRIFGTSEIEAFEVDNEPTPSINIDEIDDEIENADNSKSKNNILNRAGAAVLSIVQKAAEALTKNNGNSSDEQSQKNLSTSTSCVTLPYNILCLDCPNIDRVELENLVTCKQNILQNLLDENMQNYLISSSLCFDVLGSNLKSNLSNSNVNFVSSILPSRYLAGLCNIIAKEQNIFPSNINHTLIDTKKDQASLKNISKSESQCETNDKVNEHIKKEMKEIDKSENVIETLNDDKTKPKTDKENELNIFNVPLDKNDVIVKDKVNEIDTTTTTVIDKNSKEEVTPTTPSEIISNPPQITNDNIQQKPIVIDNGFKPVESTLSNPPESVFLRLSNRIKTLEKNMTLSTQYLEELSKRYKKQIEELQQSFSKFQTTLDNEVQKGNERDDKDGQLKFQIQQNISFLSEKLRLFEVIVGVLVLIIFIQMFIIIMIYRHVSSAQKQVKELNLTSKENETEVNVVPINLKKRHKNNRIRKISAPNILSQKYSIKTDEKVDDFMRTLSVPKMNVNENFHEGKENFIHDLSEQPRLEENDEILIPGFDDLTIKDDSSTTNNIENDETGDDLSLLSHNNKTIHQFPVRNNSLNIENRKKRPQKLHKKAMSESPPNIHRNNNENFQEFNSLRNNQMSQEVVNGNLMSFKKSNSFKKFFKKIF